MKLARVRETSDVYKDICVSFIYKNLRVLRL